MIIVSPFGKLLRLGGSPRVAAGDTLIGRIGVTSAADSARLAGGGAGLPANPDSVRVEPFNAPNYGYYISNKILFGYTNLSGDALDASSSASPLALGLGNNGVYYSSTALRAHGGKPVAIRVYGTVWLLVSGPADFKSDLIVTRGNPSAALILMANDAGGISFSSISAEAGMPVLVMTPGDLRIAKASHLGAVMVAAGGLTLGRDVYLRFDHAVMDPFLASLQVGVGIIGRIPGGPPPSRLWGASRRGGAGRGGAHPQSLAFTGGYDFRKLANLRGAIHLSSSDSLYGQFVVANSADSATLVNYSFGPAIPSGSVQVAIHDAPDFSGYLQDKIGDGYQTITSAMIGNSASFNPLLLGLNNNGVYYADSGVSVPPGLSGALKIFGHVMILVTGPFICSKDLAILAGDSDAALLILADVSSGTGISNTRVSQFGVPTLFWSRGDVQFKRSGDCPAISIFSNALSLAKGATFAYDHAVMDPVVDYYAGGNAISGVAAPGPSPTPTTKPAQLALSLAHNPARTTVRFQLALPRSGTVSLDVFDVSGRRVRHIEPGRLSAGTHPVLWDGRVVSGERAASGTYFARLVAPGGAVTKRFVLIR